MIEYPKSLYRDSVDDHVIVKDAEQEKAARADGYEMFAEIHVRAQNPESTDSPDVPKRRGRPPKKAE
jgi:hypothetical protein